LEQDECDRATASDFISGYLLNRLSDIDQPSSEPDPHIERLIPVINAYNAGRYDEHSLKTKAHNETTLNDAQADGMLTRYELATGTHGLPRPKALINRDVKPTHPRDRGLSDISTRWTDLRI